jgi:hypothetical protein
MALQGWLWRKTSKITHENMQSRDFFLLYLWTTLHIIKTWLQISECWTQLYIKLFFKFWNGNTKVIIAKMKIDQLLEKCGNFHRYQLILLICYGIVNMITSINFYSQTIITFIPKHWCVIIFSDNDLQLS